MGNQFRQVVEHTTTAIYLFGLLCFFSILLKQNQLVSDVFSLLPVREVDDYAFQVTLRTIHDAMQSFHVKSLFMTNQYGYGAIFWFINALVTYPFYLLGNEHYVILLPRCISLLFAFGSLYFIYRIAALFSDKRYLCLAAACMYALQPEFAFMSLRFHTHAQLLFFSVLGVYLLLKSTTDKKYLLWSVVSVATAIATKMNAIILLPGIVLYLFMTSNLKIWSFVRCYWKYFAAGTLLSAFLFNPAIILFPLFLRTAYHAIITLAAYIYHSGSNMGGPEYDDPLYQIKYGLFFNYSGWLTIFLAVVLVAWGLMLLKKRRQEGSFFFSFGLAFLVSVIVLSFRVKQDPFAYANYLVPLSFVICFSLLIVGRMLPKVNALLALCMLMGLFIFNHNRNEIFWYRYEEQLASAFNQLRIADHNLIRESVGGIVSRLTVLTDINIVIPFTPFDRDVNRKDFFNNFADFKDDYDILVIGKENPITWPAEKIRETFVEHDKYLQGADAYQHLLATQTFNGNTYDLMLENERFFLYRKADEET